MSNPSDPRAPRLNRRDAIRTAGALAAVASLPAASHANAADKLVVKGRIQQSVCRWCYPKQSLDELCSAAQKMGLVGIDLLTAKDFPTLKKYGLVCTMTSSHPLTDGLADPKYHESALKTINEAIETTAKEGWKNVICFSGNRRGIDDRTGMDNCVKALKQIVPVAEKAGVVLQMELLNSKVNHKDYMCDRSEWGVELVKRVGSDNFKLLYDIYHMQIMEGDVIRTIEQNHKYYGHYHTGGNPGRHEIDDSQELNYKPITAAIIGTGFKGYMAHEFIPVRDPLASLGEAVTLCDV